jgi:hypothetical protein
MHAFQPKYPIVITVFAAIVLSLSAGARADDGPATTQPAAGPTTRASGHDGDVTMGVEMPTVFACGEKNMVSVMIHNGSKKAIEFSESRALPELKGLGFAAKRVDPYLTSDVPLTRYYDSRLHGPQDEGQYPHLGPGKTLRVSINLSQFLDMTPPAAYTIAFKWEGWYAGEMNHGVKITTEPVDVDAKLAEIPVASDETTEFPTLTTKLGY